VDEHGLAIAPGRLRATKFDHRGAPDFAAILCAKARQLALAAYRINEVAVDRRSAARAVAPIVGESRAERRRPNLLARPFIERQQIASVVAVTHDVESTTGEGWAGVAGTTGVDHPEPPRAAFGPGLEQAGFV